MPQNTMLQLNQFISLTVRLCLIFVLFATSALVAQSGKIININLQCLGWDGNVRAVVQEPDGELVSLVASQKIISTVIKVRSTNPLKLYHATKQGSKLGNPMAVVPLKPGVKDILLILRKRGEGYDAISLPFSKDDFPENTATFLNLTSSPVFAQIDGQRQIIQKGARHQVPYTYEYAKKESLRTKFAVEQNGRLRLVQNSHVPLMNQGRVLFFISKTASDSKRKARYPVSFTYAYDSMLASGQGLTAEELAREEEEMLSE